MADKVYESMFIFNANAYARNPAGAGNNIREIVESVGGELLASRMWNEQKLAYPINGQRKGVYWLSYVKMDADVLPKFNRACKLNDIIIRHLVISVDPRLVDTLVAAANETKTAAPAAETAPAEPKKEEAKSEKKEESVAAE
ncbi:MAG: 30S ribosomal protein S6 [Planctomycetota bacterium]